MSDKIYLKEITLPIVETGENETYSFVQTDDGLDTPGDAADSKETGDRLNSLKEDLNDSYLPKSDFVKADCSAQTTSTTGGTHNGVTWTKNSDTDWSASGTASGSVGSYRNLIGTTSAVPDKFYGSQKLEIKVNSTDDDILLVVTIYSVTQPTRTLDLKTGTHYVTLPVDISGLLVRVQVRTGNVADGRITFTITGFYNTYITPTGDTSDRTNFINKILRYAKTARLAPGVFYVNALDVPDGSELTGCGSNSVLRLTDLGEYVLNLNDKCNVSNLRIIGADSDITLPSADFEPEEGTTNYASGLSWTSSNGYISAPFGTTVSTGKYILKINVSSTNESDVYVRFLDQTTYGSTHIVYTAIVPNGEDAEIVFDAETAIKSIYIFAASSVGASSGYTVTLTSIEFRTITSVIGSRNGILWKTPNKHCSVVDNCTIERFNGAGILAKDTSTPVDNNLVVSNCYIRNNAVGVYIQRDSEYMKICNNIIASNWYGILNRGGNNNICNCGMDSNIVGVQVDADEGSNNGHGTITGCSINHSGNNSGYGLIIKNTGREIISNCNFYYSKIKLDHTNGNVITGCGFGSSAGWEISGGNCNIFNGCMIRSASDTPITIENNTTTKIVNCFTRSGVAVTVPS